jgi:hypothetical protein
MGMSPISGPWCAQLSPERFKALLGDSLLTKEELGADLGRPFALSHNMGGRDRAPHHRIYQHLSDDDKKVILSAYPRLHMKQMLTTCLCDIAKNHPNTTRDNFIADFGLKFVPGYTRVSSVDFLHQAPFAE